MSNVVVAKELLKKGIALNDQELINMANILLGDSEPPKKRGRGRPKKKVEVEIANKVVDKPSSKHYDIAKFTRDPKPNKTSPVKGSGVNNFIDDGTEAKSDITPTIKLVARTRSNPERIDRICGTTSDGLRLDGAAGCGKTFNLLKQNVPDYFVCPRCIESRIKRG